MKKYFTVLIVAGTIFFLRLVSSWFSSQSFNVSPPNFESSFIVLRKGSSLPLYGAIQSQQRFSGGPQIFFNREVEVTAKSLLKYNKPLIAEDEVQKDSLNLYVWTEICKQSIDSLIYHPLFPHLPEQKKYTSKLDFDTLNLNFGFYLFGKLKTFSEGAYRLRVSSTNVAFQVWLSPDENPQNATLVLHEGRKESENLNLKGSQYIGIILKTGSYNGEFSLSWLKPGANRYSSIPKLCLESYQKGSMYLKTDEIQQMAILKSRISLSEMHDSEDDKEKFMMSKLVHMPGEDTADLFPTCAYDPSYIIKEKLPTQYAGQWETHFTSIYPDDKSDMTMYHTNSNLPHVIFGNSIVKRNVVESVVSKVQAAVQKKHKK